jgi:hypothetical protein
MLPFLHKEILMMIIAIILANGITIDELNKEKSKTVVRW